MNFFQQLVSRKKMRLEIDKSKISLDQIKEMSTNEFVIRNFYKAIQPRRNAAISMIGDLKGVALPVTDNKLKVVPVTSAINFQSAKVQAIAVNPDEFKHMPNFSVDKIRRSTSIPILSTELIVEEYQIYRALLEGFDAIRIFSANHSFTEVGRLIELANTLNLSVVFECVSKGDIDKATQAGAKILNIRNIPIKLSTTPIANSILLKKFIPNTVTSISHGNIRNNSQVRQLEELNYDCIMLDDFIIRQFDIAGAIKDLLK